MRNRRDIIETAAEIVATILTTCVVAIIAAGTIKFILWMF